MLRAVSRMTTVIRLAPVTEGTASVENDVRMLAKSRDIVYIIQVYYKFSCNKQQEEADIFTFCIFFLLFFLFISKEK